ncbi:MAG TPA: DUF5410 domain-containing protein [Rickettsia endosymbiont of Columbicola hoogstraali]|nr:DUF5410 domain-containing protein [Rickettsia endosymbiont of Columbicola hoogstraali]
MKLTKFFCITVERNDNEYDIIAEHIIYNIKSKKITLEDLQELQKLSNLSKHIKQLFLLNLESKISDEGLHSLNEKIMEHAINLSASEDLSFFLRKSDDSILRNLLYLEAIRNNFTVEFNEEGDLTINFPNSILQLYKLLVNNFYLKKLQDDETRKKIYNLHQKNLKDASKDELENHYVKQSLAESTMCLFISKYINEHDLNKVFKLPIFKRKLDNSLKLGYPDNKDTRVIVVNKVLNDIDGIYISNLASSDILESVMYSNSKSDDEIITVKVLGTIETEL